MNSTSEILHRNVSNAIIRAADEITDAFNRVDKELHHYLIQRVKEVPIISGFCWAMGSYSLEVTAKAPWYWWNGEDDYRVSSTYLLNEGSGDFEYQKTRSYAYESLCRAGLQEQAEACFEILRVCEDFERLIDIQPGPIKIDRNVFGEVRVSTEW